ncbi:uncharacterized protein [Miscanthus floridulus]|uniref:uncharacterized protein n=1 Tax=Miscanthus floridulus TaxID=154761 RepID=UPI00345A0771
MQARHLWDAVEYDDVEFDDDRSALDAICSTVPAEMVPALATKLTAKEAWEAIKTLRIGDDRVRKATAQAVRCKYKGIAIRDGESIEDFTLRLTNIVQRLAMLGDPEPDEKVVAKYLRVARPRYKQLVISIETLLDISTLSIEEVTGRLKAADDEPPPAQTVAGKLLLTKEQWIERYKKRDQGSNRGGSTSGSRGKRRGRGRGRGAGGSNDSRAGSSTGRPIPDDECKHCGKKGHWAKDCRTKKREEQAHAAQDDEPTLLLAISSTHEQESSYSFVPSPPPHSQVPPPPHGSGPPSLAPLLAQPPPAPPLTQPPPIPTRPATPATQDGAALHLVEQKVHATLDAAEDRDPKRWILDTGASNHMSGSRAAFADLDTGITGTVRFSDGAIAQIEGSGTVLFACKNGEHRSLPNVYYLPHLTANIISVGQLDEAGYQVLVEDGVMRIHDEERRLLTKIHRSPGRLYVLDVTIARPVCLAARVDDDA